MMMVKIAYRLKRTSMILVLLLSFTGLFAGTTGKIAGIIRDAETQEPLVGLNVMVVEKMRDGVYTDVSTSSLLGASTDINGEFFIINISPGIYTVKLSYIGYQTKTIRDIRVAVDLTVRIEETLGLATLQAGEEVIVTANRTKVKMDLTSSQVSVGSDQIDALPARTIDDIIKLQAGVVQGAGGELHIRGGRSSEITYLIDGVAVTDPLNRQRGMTVDDQSIAELKTISGTFNAEYGQALSGVVNIVTKDGTEDFRYYLSADFGDYYSADPLYSNMNNRDWAEAVARFNSGDFQALGWYLLDHPDFDNRDSDKPHLSKEKYQNSYKPTRNVTMQGNVSGPIPMTRNKLTYFLSGSYSKSEGHTYGLQYFMPWGFQDPVMGESGYDFPEAKGTLVPLSSGMRYNAIAKLSLAITPRLRLTYGNYINLNESYSVGYTRKYVPDGGMNYYTESTNQILTLKHAPSNRAFYDIKAAFFNKHHESHLYDNVTDPRYIPDSEPQKFVFGPASDLNLVGQSEDFLYYGNSTSRSVNDVSNISLSADLTNQMTQRHLIKLGASGKWHELSNDYYNIEFDSDFIPYVPVKNSRRHIYYSAKPSEFAGYIQDKIEFQELIINIGLRYDSFVPDAYILADPMDPQIYEPDLLSHIYQNYDPSWQPGQEDSLGIPYTVEEREAFWFKKTSAKSQISPRFGLSFPISEKGVIHFSYGQFFQNPEFRYLYYNPNYWIRGAGTEALIGNGDLDAERTVQYELGLQQELADNVYLHVTGFYRDIRGWVGSGHIVQGYNGTYHQWVNMDHGSSQGLTVTNSYQFSALNISMDYTYMTAVGTASDPRSAFSRSQSNQEPIRELILLNWDQPHTFNLVTGYRSKGWDATLVGNFASGKPYTPSFVRGTVVGGGTFSGLLDNTSRAPSTFNIDFRLVKSFNFGDSRVQAFCNITNLLDTRNELYVYSETGLADFSLNTRDPSLPSIQASKAELASIEEYNAAPGRFSAPRNIRFGLRVSR